MKQKILQDLREKILSEYFQQGQSLIERELCDMYGVSRSPIREILWKLVLDGIVEQRPARGFFVRKLDWEQIFEIYQTREAIEGMGARLAAYRANQSQIKQLSRIREELIRVDVNKNPGEGSQSGRKMHHTIMEAASNRFMNDFYQKISYLAKLTSNISVKNNTIEEESKKYHLMIIQAIIDRDVNKSELYMREHLRVTCKNIIENFYPEVFTSFLKEEEAIDKIDEEKIDEDKIEKIEKINKISKINKIVR